MKVKMVGLIGTERLVREYAIPLAFSYSTPFTVEPLPDDFWSITVKGEIADRFRHLPWEETNTYWREVE